MDVPKTDYGYIKVGEILGNYYLVESFKEKASLI